MFNRTNIKQQPPDSAYPSFLTKKHNYPVHIYLPKSVLVKPINGISRSSIQGISEGRRGQNLAAPTLTAVPEEQVSRVSERKSMAATAREERSSEEMSVATKRSLAAAENGSSPIHWAQVLLRSWIPEKVRHEVRRKAPAMRAVVMGEVRCCSGIRSERARSGMRYGRWAEILILEVI
jgi:hypothetical protein